MRFPTFWKKVKNARGTVVARGWSDVSAQEAAQRAEARLQKILQALGSRRQNDLQRYPYEADDVICEEVVQRIGEAEQEIAILSRNAYGALVMNARHMMFIDIDFPAIPRQSWLSKLFRSPPIDPLQVQLQTLERIKEWQAAHDDWTLRLYRTFAGLRVIVVNHSFDHVDATVLLHMQQLGCDELYIKLCKTQACFRARLSPKPWRVGMPNPPMCFPFETHDHHHAFDQWLEQMTAQSSGFSVCIYLETLGRAEILAEHRPLIEIHDEYCCKAGAAQLA
jgi:hypothetical protein